MKELTNFILDTNDQSFNSILDDQSMNYAVDTTTINPNTPPPGYKIELDAGYGTVTETKDKKGPQQESVVIDGKTVSIIDPKTDDYIPFNEVETTNLYELNLEFIGNLNKEKSNVDFQYSARVFSELKRFPVINNKQYTLAEIEAVFKDPKQTVLQKKIMEQARKLSTNPELSIDARWELTMIDYNGILLEGQIQAASLKFDKSLLATASVADARRHAAYHTSVDKKDQKTIDRINVLKEKKNNKSITKRENDELIKLETGAKVELMEQEQEKGVIFEPHTFLFKPDGRLKTFEEFAIDYINKYLPNYNQNAAVMSNRLVATNQSQFTYNDKGERVANNMYKMKEQQMQDHWNQMKEQAASVSEEDYKKYVQLYREKKFDEAEAFLKKAQQSRTNFTNLNRMIREGQGKPTFSTNYGETPEKKTSPIKKLEAATPQNWHVIVRDMGRGYFAMGDKRGGNTFSYNNLKKNYDQYLLRIKDEYNYEKQPTAFKLGAEIQSDFLNRFENNKGGEIKGTKQSFTLDLANPVAYQETYTEVDPVTGEEITKRKNVPTPGAKQFIELYQIVKNDQGDIRYSVGAIGEVPTDNTKRDVILQLLQETFVTTTNRDDKGKIKGKVPTGTVSYQGVVAGQTEYHAFNIKFNQDYLNQSKFKGTDKNPGLVKEYPDLLTGGLTIYIPRNISESKTTLGIQNYNSRTISAVEALVALNGRIDLEIPNSGALTIEKNDKDGSFDISGYTVVLNPNTLKMDTSKIEMYKVPYSATFDVDQNVNDVIKSQMYQNFMFNNLMYNELLKQKGEKDPSKLMLPVPYAPPQK